MLSGPNVASNAGRSPPEVPLEGVVAQVDELVARLPLVPRDASWTQPDRPAIREARSACDSGPGDQPRLVPAPLGPPR